MSVNVEHHSINMTANLLNDYEQRYTTFLFPGGVRITPVGTEEWTEEEQLNLENIVQFRITYSMLKCYIGNLKDDLVDSYMTFKKQRKVTQWKQSHKRQLNEHLFGMLLENGLYNALGEIRMLLDTRFDALSLTSIELNSSTCDQRNSFMKNIKPTFSVSDYYKEKIDSGIVNKGDLGFSSACLFDFPEGVIKFDTVEDELTMNDLQKIRVIKDLYDRLESFLTEDDVAAKKQCQKYGKKMNKLIEFVANLEDTLV